MESKIAPVRKKLNLIQAFRGVAALLVVLFHVDQLSTETLNQRFLFNIFKFGWAGVDFFFVLSGFIILFVHYSDVGQQSLTRFKSFIIKRFIRIYPAYWVVLFTILGLTFIFPLFAKESTSNVEIIFNSIFLFPQGGQTVLNVSWTLVQEIFFYFMFSLTILLKPIFYIPIISAWILGNIIQSGGMFTISKELSPWLWTVFNSMNLEFLFGCLAAYLVLNYNISFKKPLLILGVTLFGVAGIFYAIAKVSDDLILLDTQRVFTFGILAFAIVISSTSMDLNQTLEVPEFMIYIGDASYSIYIVHGPAISVLMKLIAKFNLAHLNSGSFLILNIITTIMVVGISCIFHSFIEKPLLELCRKKILPGKT